MVVVLAVAALAAVAVPLLRGNSTPGGDAREYAGEPAPEPAGTFSAGPSSPDPEAGPDAVLEAEIGRYRDAIVAGTLCRRCGQPNPPGACFCSDCGRPLPAGDEQEFAR